MRFVLRLAVICVIGAMASATRAEEPSQEAVEAARNVFALLFDHALGRQNELAVSSAWPAFERALRKDNPAIEEAALVELRQEFTRIRREHLKELLKEFPNSMARHAGAQELNDLAAFYRTPSGIKILEAVPMVMAEGFAQVLPRLRAVNDDTHAAFLALLRKRGLLRGQSN
jgi:hypothetical protein